MGVTKDSLVADLHTLGIRPGGVLLVHSSMKSLGYVEGGPAAVIAALRETIGPGGTLVLPTLTYDRVNLEHPRFDVRNTACCVGLIPETFRQMPGVVRSLHPTHSLAAIGPRAAELMAGHDKQQSPGAMGSPYHKIVQAGGFILFLGTGIACNTMLHCVEEWAGLAESLTPELHGLEVVDYDGRVLAVPQHRHVGHRSQFYAKMGPLFLKHAIMTQGKVAAAGCDLIDSRKMTDYVLGVLAQHRDLFTHDRVEMLE